MLVSLKKTLTERTETSNGAKHRGPN